jgi:UDP-2,3-diacylglucosamine pyrophosphatase LpxH
MYHLLLKSNTWLNWVRQRCGKDYWSLAIFLKRRVKNAVKYIERYEDAAFKAARTNTVDAIICGHIHRAEIINSGSLTYMNCGDWVESCTALVEHPDGRMELLQWRERVKSLKALRVPGPSPLVEDWAA